jgi:hypothetical protein
MKFAKVACVLMLFVSLYEVHAIKQFNYCKNTNEICLGQYDKRNMYAEKCEPEMCSSYFKYF